VNDRPEEALFFGDFGHIKRNTRRLFASKQRRKVRGSPTERGRAMAQAMLKNCRANNFGMLAFAALVEGDIRPLLAGTRS
jgi:hypothetical protein